MSITLSTVLPDFTLTKDDKQQHLDDIAQEVALEASIKRQTPSLADIEITPMFRYNPVFLRINPTKGRAVKTLATIVEAIEAILAHPQLGINRMNTNLIARVAGVSIGTIYRYFEDEIALLDFVFPERIVYLTQG